MFKMKNILNMSLGDTMKVDTDDPYLSYHVVRVPGGWIFHNILIAGQGEYNVNFVNATATFVPLTTQP